LFLLQFTPPLRSDLGISFGVHFGKIGNGVIQGIASRRIDLLLALHGALHDGVVRFEGLHVLLVTGKDFLLDALTQAVFRHERNDFLGVFLLGKDPARHLVHGEQVGTGRGVEFGGLDHAFADGFCG